MNVFDEVESGVRHYCRRWPTVFRSATGSTLVDEQGRSYLDFFAGAGALSYGHNDPVLIEAAVTYLRSGGLTHSLDVFTPEKRNLLEALRDLVLAPTKADLVVQFVGPTGATAVEAALRLAQRVTGRRTVVAFEGGYHGMTERSAEVSASLDRGSQNCTFLPYVGQVTDRDLDRLAVTMRGVDGGPPPGAVIIEPVQGEGGARPFDPTYLREVRRLASEHGVVVIADDVQAGVGRTGPFLSGSDTGLDPDVICLSKAISGLGLPMAINLVRRDLDIWEPGEFTGTFRGSNLAFVTSTVMLRTHWSDTRLAAATARKGRLVAEGLHHAIERAGPGPAEEFVVVGRGLLWGLETRSAPIATAIAAAAFDRGLLVETCGPGGGTVKVLPPLVIDDDDLATGLDRLADAAASVLHDVAPTATAGAQ